MYTLLYEHTDTSHSIVNLLKSVCEIALVKTDDSWRVEEYRLRHCFPSKSAASWSLEFTKEEVERDFYMTIILPLAKRNGYRLYEEVQNAFD